MTNQILNLFHIFQVAPLAFKVGNDDSSVYSIWLDIFYF